MAKKKVSKKRTKSTKKVTKKQLKEDNKKVVEQVENSAQEVASVESVAEKPQTKDVVSDSNTNWRRIGEVSLKALISIALIWGFVWVTGSYIPSITGDDVTTEVAEEEVQTVSEDVLAAEDEVLEFGDQEVVIKTNYGDIAVDLKAEGAPRHVESFVRLSYRDYYDGLTFHRMVEGPEFSVIQGGDPDGTGTGGASAFGTPIEDELWAVEPEFGDVDGSQGIVNDPEFSDPSLYADFDKTLGTVRYRKGLLVMAKTAAPDSAGSQFFVTLNDTILPAQYTVFGVVKDESIGTLDKITDEVDPIDDSESDTKDGTPNQEITIDDVELKNI